MLKSFRIMQNLSFTFSQFVVVVVVTTQAINFLQFIQIATHIFKSLSERPFQGLMQQEGITVPLEMGHFERHGNQNDGAQEFLDHLVHLQLSPSPLLG